MSVFLAVLPSLAGLVYVCGWMLIMLVGLYEVRGIARDEPGRPWKLVALAWVGAAMTWPALIVVAAVVIFFGDSW